MEKGVDDKRTHAAIPVTLKKQATRMGFFGIKKKSKKGKKEEAKAAAGQKNGNQGETVGLTDANQKQQASSPQQQQASQEAPAQQQQQQQQQQAPPAAAQEQFSTTVTDMPVGDPAFAKADVTRNLVKKFISDIWNRGDLDLIPQVCSPKIRFNGNTGLDKIGHDGFAMMVATIHAALSDYHCEIHSMVVEDNKAFCRLRFSGKHTGDLLGYPPTGRVVSWMGATEFTCMNGRILKVWELGDLFSLQISLSEASQEQQLQIH